MAITSEALSNLTYFMPEEFVVKLSTLVTLVQALGGVLIIYLVVQIINIILGRKKNKELAAIKTELQSIKTRLDYLTKK